MQFSLKNLIFFYLSYNLQALFHIWAKFELLESLTTLLSELDPFSDDGWFEDKIKATEALVSEIGKQLSSKAAAAKDDDDTKAKPKSESPAGHHFQRSMYHHVSSTTFTNVFHHQDYTLGLLY